MALIELQDIWRIYGRNQTEIVKALEGINLGFERGEFVSIQGPSGCGKSTLLNILSGMELPSRGQILIDQKSTANFTKNQWDSYRKNNLGFVFQHFNLIDTLTALENVALVMSLSGIPSRQRIGRAKELLTLVGLGDRMGNTPLELSGGQKQRVAIARALANDPDILLADEPTGSLDSVTAHEIMELLKQVSKEKLVIMVTHNQELARTYGTRIIHMQDGKVISDERLVEISPSGLKKLKDKNASMPFAEALRLSFRSMKSRWGRILTTAIAGSIGIAGVAITIGLGMGVNAFVDEQSNLLIDSNRFDLFYYDEVVSEWDPSYSYYQRVKVPLEKVEELVSHYEGISWNYSLNTFLTEMGQNLVISSENEDGVDINLVDAFVTTISDAEVLQTYVKYLVTGSRLPENGSTTEVIVNNMFIHLLATSQGLDRDEYMLEDYLNTSFNVDFSYTVYDHETSLDKIEFNQTFTIVGISEELEFLAMPRLFTTHSGWENYLNTIELPLLSEEIDEPTSLFDYVTHSCDFSQYPEYCNDTLEIVVEDTALITETFDALNNDPLMYQINSNFEIYQAGLSVESPGNFIRMGLSTILSVAQAVLLIFVFVALGVAAILIAIVLFASSLERKLEIGILKAVGARDKDVRRVFLAEAMLIGSYAGLVGIGLGFLIQTIIYYLSPQLLNLKGPFYIVQIPLVGWTYSSQGIIEQIPLLVPLGLVILAIIVSLIAGYIPAKRATSMRVVEALREE